MLNSNNVEKYKELQRLALHQTSCQGVVTTICPALPAVTGTIDRIHYTLMEKGRNRSCTLVYTSIYYKKSSDQEARKLDQAIVQASRDKSNKILDRRHKWKHRVHSGDYPLSNKQTPSTALSLTATNFCFPKKHMPMLFHSCGDSGEAEAAMRYLERATS